MNRVQAVILCVGVLVVASFLLYVPWYYQSGNIDRPLGYGFIFSPPVISNVQQRVNYERVFPPIIVTIALTGCAYWFGGFKVWSPASRAESAPGELPANVKESVTDLGRRGH